MKRTKTILLSLITLFTTCNLLSQEVYKLWEGIEKPFYKENNLKEYEKRSWGTKCVYNITEPTLTVFKAKGNNSGKGVVVIPGGGYQLVAMYHEGYDVAKALAEKGITAAVLKYRLPNPESSYKPEMVPLSDTRRALKLFRQHAGKYGFDKNKVGVLGFSAGSHLSTVVSLWTSDNKDENPNFSGLIYGVTELTTDNQKWLEESLYYRKLTQEEVKQNTLLNLVTPKTPPAFLVHAYDDKVCNVKESTLYAEKLHKKGVDAEMHLFPSGGHGFGLGRNASTKQWLPLFTNWVKSNF